MLELLLCRVPDSDVIQDMAAKYGITEPRFFKDEGENNRYKCIACALCTQVCEEVVGVCAISMQNRGREKTPGTPYHKDSLACIGCGACAYACPTHAIAMEDGKGVRKIWGRKFKMVACSVCGNPYIPEAQVDWIVKTTGKDKIFLRQMP